MLKTLTLAIALSSALAGFSATTASATPHTTAAQCQALYDLSRFDPQSYRANRDAYISCLSSLS